MLVYKLLAVALVFAGLITLVLLLALASMNELDRKDCGNCGMYDRTLHTCWLKFEERYPGDEACDRFYRADDDTEENT